MNFIIFGPQASGKGTQAQLLAQRLGFFHFNLGETLRRLAKEKNALGKQIDVCINQKGVLVPDPIIAKVVKEQFFPANLKKGIIFDGFPRTRAQVDLLDLLCRENHTRVDLVFALNLPRSVIFARLAGRRVCPRCGINYHLQFNPPQKDSICDQCLIPLITRKDDFPDQIKARLAAYEAQTAPLLKLFNHRRILIEVDANRPIETIYNDLVSYVHPS